MNNTSHKRKSLNKITTAKLEVETQVMEDRIIGLKQILQSQKEMNKTQISSGSTRWSAASTNQPLKNYANKVLQQKKQSIGVGTIRLNSKQRAQSGNKKQRSTSQSFTKPQNENFLTMALSSIQDQGLNQNLNRAINVQKQSQNEVVKYLTSLNLEQHAGILLENGFDEMEILKDIQIEHVNDMKIPPLEARKLLNAINKDSSKTKLKTKNVVPVKKQKPSKFDGVYDEQANQMEFQQALMAYRDQSSQQQKEQLKKQDQILEIQNEDDDDDNIQLGYVSSRKRKQEDEQKNKLKFLFGGDNVWQNFDLGMDTNIITENQKPIILNKTSCYSCFKVISVDTQFRKNDKTFCSQDCLQQFDTQDIYLCRACTCEKQIDIGDAYYQFGMWFCDENCFKQYQWETKNIRGNTINICL